MSKTEKIDAILTRVDDLDIETLVSLVKDYQRERLEELSDEDLELVYRETP